MKEQKKKYIKRFFLFLIILLTLLITYWTDLQEFYDRKSLEEQKLVETKIVSVEKLEELRHDQFHLRESIWSDSTRRWRWLFYEIRDGESALFDSITFMRYTHPEYDLIEVKLPITRYVYQDGVIIEFFSGKGVITKVHSKNGWEEYKDTEKQ